MNTRIKKQYEALQEDDYFQFLYEEYRKASVAGDALKKNVLRVSISDYVIRKYTRVLKVFKRYIYKALWKYFGKRDFAENYHNNIGMRPKVN